MIQKTTFSALIFLLVSIVSLQAQPKIIFDTDIGGDADDLGALAMLHHLHDAGECELLAVMCWSLERDAVPNIDAVNRYYGHPDIPIGRRKGEASVQEWNYNRAVSENFPHELTHEDVMPATELYRQLLSQQPDSSVTVVVVGPLYNIQALLQSQPDEYSPLSGKELVGLKVKEFSIMGGKFPQGEGEWNFDGGMEGVTQYVLENLEVPITFSGFEVGVAIKTGAVFNDIDPNTPLYKGFMHFSEHAPWMKDQFKGKILDNSSYDQTSVLYAVRGGIGEYWERVIGGHCVAEPNGDNRWVSGKPTHHSYLRLIVDGEEMAELIEAMMLGEF